jgi:hypothetical protein
MDGDLRTSGGKFGCCDSNGIIWSIWNSSAIKGTHRKGKHIEANSILWGCKLKGQDCKICFWSVVRGNYFNASPT